MTAKTSILTILFLLICPFLNAQNLSEYQAVADTSNPGLKAKFKAFEVAMERSAQVNSLPDPVLSFGYFISPVETRLGPQQAKFSLTQLFPWFGTLQAQGDQYALLAQAEFQLFLDEKNRLHKAVALQYFELIQIEEWLIIEKENLRLLESYKNISIKKFENNTGEMVDVLRVDLLLQAAKSSIEILTNNKKPVLVAFNVLLNRDIESEVFLTEDSEFFDLDLSLHDSILMDNPRIRELGFKIEATQAQELLARRQGMPKLGVGVDYILVGERTDISIPDNGRDVVMPMVSVSLPIFRKKYKAAQSQASLMQESFIFEKEAVINDLTSSYHLHLFEVGKQLELVNLYHHQGLEAEQALSLLYASYANSSKDFDEVLRMQQLVLSYKKLKSKATKDYLKAMAQMQYVLAD